MHDEKRDPLNLSRLPQPEPPGDPWPAIAAALQRRRHRRIGAWAAAATVALSLGLAWQLREMPAPGTGAPDDAGANPMASAASGTPTEPAARSAATASEPEPAADPSTTDADTLAQLIALSQQLETRLQVLRARTGTIPAGMLVYQVELEDLVAQVDDALSRRPESQALWSQRVNLLLDLDQLYRQELRREQGLVASL